MKRKPEIGKAESRNRSLRASWRLWICAFCFLFTTSHSSAVLSTNKTFVVNNGQGGTTNNVLRPSATNFFVVNSNLLNQSINTSPGSGGGGGGGGSGIFNPGQFDTNGDGQVSLSSGLDTTNESATGIKIISGTASSLAITNLSVSSNSFTGKTNFAGMVVSTNGYEIAGNGSLISEHSGILDLFNNAEGEVTVSANSAGDGKGLLVAGTFNGAVGVSDLNGGAGANGDTFWRGDGTWAPAQLPNTYFSSPISPGAITNLFMIGDSIAYGAYSLSPSTETITPSNSFPQQIANYFGIGLNNQAVNGTTSMDGQPYCFAHAVAPQELEGDNYGINGCGLLSSNDMSCALANDAWLSFYDADKIKGQFILASALYGSNYGHWSNSATYLSSWMPGAWTTNVGDYSIVTNIVGRSIVLGILNATNHWYSSFNVYIDGISQGLFTNQMLPYVSAVGTANKFQEAVLLFSGLSDGMHVLTLTNIGIAGNSNLVSIEWVGLPDMRHGFPQVIHSGISAPNTNTILSPYVYTQYPVWDAGTLSNVVALKLLGLKVDYLPMSGVLNYPSDIDFLSGAPYIHPNMAGTAKLAAQWERFLPYPIMSQNVLPGGFLRGGESAFSAATNYNWSFGTNTISTIAAGTNVFFTSVSGGPGLASFIITNTGAAGKIIQIGFPTNAMALITNMSSGAVFALDPTGTNYYFTLTNEPGRVVYISANKLTTNNTFSDIVYSCATSLP